LLAKAVCQPMKLSLMYRLREQARSHIWTVVFLVYRGACIAAMPRPDKPAPTFLTAFRQLPVRPDEVAGVAVGNAFQVILMLRLCFPEWPRRFDFGHHTAGPQC